MNKITPPDSLKGRLTSERTGDRDILFLKYLEEGHDVKAIAHAFDVNISAVYRRDLVREYIRKLRLKPKDRTQYRHIMGVEIGSIPNEIGSINREEFDSLIIQSKKNGMTIAQLLVSEWKAKQ